MVDQTLLLTSAGLPLCPGQHFCTTKAACQPILVGEKKSGRKNLFPCMGSKFDIYSEVNASLTMWNCSEPSFEQRKYWTVGAATLWRRPQSCLKRREEVELWVSEPPRSLAA